MLIASQKYGGSITPEPKSADYIVLSPQADHFETHLINTIILQKPAIQSEFIHACIRKGHLVDPEEYSFHGINLKPRRGRPGKVVDLHALRELHAPENELKKKLTQKSGKSRGEKAKTSSKAKKASTDETKSPPQKEAREASPSSSPMQVEVVLTDISAQEPAIAGEDEEDELESEEEDVVGPVSIPPSAPRAVTRSPSPIPPAQGVAYLPGKHYYTADDVKFFEAYVSHLLKYAPEMTMTQLSQKLYKKVSHHILLHATIFTIVPFTGAPSS